MLNVCRGTVDLITLAGAKADGHSASQLAAERLRTGTLCPPAASVRDYSGVVPPLPALRVADPLRAVTPGPLPTVPPAPAPPSAPAAPSASAARSASALPVSVGCALLVDGAAPSPPATAGRRWVRMNHAIPATVRAEAT